MLKTVEGVDLIDVCWDDTNEIASGWSRSDTEILLCTEIQRSLVYGELQFGLLLMGPIPAGVGMRARRCRSRGLVGEIVMDLMRISGVTEHLKGEPV